MRTHALGIRTHLPNTCRGESDSSNSKKYQRHWHILFHRAQLVEQCSGTGPWGRQDDSSNHCEVITGPCWADVNCTVELEQHGALMCTATRTFAADMMPLPPSYHDRLYSLVFFGISSHLCKKNHLQCQSPWSAKTLSKTGTGLLLQ
jgi:hypothetical protein